MYVASKRKKDRWALKEFFINYKLNINVSQDIFYAEETAFQIETPFCGEKLNFFTAKKFTVLLYR